MKPTGDRREFNGSRSRSWALGLAGLAVGAVLLAVQVRADDGAPAAPAAPAARAVRLSSVDGEVRVAQGSQVLATAAIANTPLFEGSVVTTGDTGQAEVQFEDGSVARLSPNSSLALTVLRGQGASAQAEITVQSGLGYVELGGSNLAGSIAVRLADAQVTVSGFTVLRVNLDNPPGELAVFSGNARLERAGEALDLHGGETVALAAAGSTGDSVAESIEPDSWDAWNADRDQAMNSEAAARTGAANGLDQSGNPAWNDLDANGNWYNVPDQGYIWSPNDAADAGFDPYGYGNWMYTPGYGYVFVSGYSWGYLPFQCGSWNYYETFGWGWMPGARGCMPWWGTGIYRPNIGIGFGGYRRPMPPRRPMPVGGRGAGGGPYPLIAVNRRAPGPSATLPARDRNTAVTIAGHTVQALRPLSPRPQYERAAAGAGNRPSYPGMGQSGGSARATAPGWGGSRPGGGVYSGGTATRTYGSTSRSATPTQHGAAPTHTSSGGGSAGHASSGGGGGHAGGGGGGHR